MEAVNEHIIRIERDNGEIQLVSVELPTLAALKYAQRFEEPGCKVSVLLNGVIV